MKKIILFPIMFNIFVLQAQNKTEIIWQKYYGGSQTEKAYAMDKTKDGGCIVAGSTNSINGDVTVSKGQDDVLIIKLDTAGKLEWQKTFGGSGDEEARSVIQVKDGGYIVAASSKSKDGDAAGYNDGTKNNYLSRPNFWIIKLNADGNIQWQKSYGGPHDDTPSSVEVTTDGGYIVAGKSQSTPMKNISCDVTDNHGGYDYWVIKLDASGTVQWKKSYGGKDWDICSVIKQTANGYIMAGYSKSNDADVTKTHLDDEYWVVALDMGGNISWQKTYGGNGSDLASDITLAKDGGFLIAGTSASSDGDAAGINLWGKNCWLIKISVGGDIQWQKTFGGGSADFGSSVKVAADGSIYFAGYTNSKDACLTGYKGGFDFYVVKMK